MNLLGSSSKSCKYNDSQLLNILKKNLGASYERFGYGKRSVRQNGVDLFIPYVRTDLEQIDVGEEHRYVRSAQKGVVLSSEQAKMLLNESGLKEKKAKDALPSMKCALCLAVREIPSKNATMMVCLNPSCGVKGKQRVLNKHWIQVDKEESDKKPAAKKKDKKNKKGGK